jgi:hypothetical protein
MRYWFPDPVNSDRLNKTPLYIVKKIRDDAIREVRDAWRIEGSNPEHYRLMRNKLRKEWPMLAYALDELGEQQ